MSARRWITAGAVIVAALLLGACSDGGDEELREITFMAGFRAQANLPFVAAYVADRKGFFEDEGLKVNIRHSSGQDEHLKLLLDGAIEFTTGTAAQVLRRRAGDLPVHAVALFGQRGDQGFVARADSGIVGPADFEGRSVGFKAGVVPAELHALLATVGLTVDDVKLQAVGFDPRIFIEGAVDIFPVFLSNEPDTIRRTGLAINIIDPHDFDVPTLGVAYLVEDGLAAADRDLVERFLRATLRGAAYAAANIDEAIEITLEFAEGADPDHQRFLLETDLRNAQRSDGIGRATLAQWEALNQLLVRFEVLDAPADVAAAFDGSIVDGLYERNEIN